MAAGKDTGLLGKMRFQAVHVGNDEDIHARQTRNIGQRHDGLIFRAIKAALPRALGRGDTYGYKPRLAQMPRQRGHPFVL